MKVIEGVYNSKYESAKEIIHTCTSNQKLQSLINVGHVEKINVIYEFDDTPIMPITARLLCTQTDTGFN